MRYGLEQLEWENTTETEESEASTTTNSESEADSYVELTEERREEIGYRRGMLLEDWFLALQRVPLPPFLSSLSSSSDSSSSTLSAFLLSSSFDTNNTTQPNSPLRELLVGLLSGFFLGCL